MLQIRPMAPCIGDEISGVDVRELDDDSFAPIHPASGLSRADHTERE
jgi:hypothetical protein